MIKPTPCRNEAERIKALLHLNVLDTKPELEYDDIVFLASEVCQVPIALVSLVDTDRQWFKAKWGIDASQTSRDISFCGHALHHDDVFVVPDATADERFCDNPLVTGQPEIRFYAGAPLRLPTGEALGTLCVIDRAPKKLTDGQKTALSKLAKQVVAHLIARRSENQQKDRSEEVLRLLNQIETILEQRNAILENLSEGLVYQDTKGEIIAYNSSALQILGLTADQLIGRTSMDPSWRSVRPDGKAYPGNEHPAMRTLASGQGIKNDVMGLTLPDGSFRWISINTVPICDNLKNLSGVVATFADITEDRKKAQQLIESAKMAALGLMAGGIAHEINTPLQIILSNLDLAQMRLDEGQLTAEHAKECIQMIRNTTLRIDRIVKAMSVVSRDSKSDQQQKMTVGKIIADCLVLCEDKLKTNEIEFRIEGGEEKVLCNPSEIAQVLLNLIANSLYATRSLKEKWIAIRTLDKPDYVEVSITDSGTGIENSIAENMMVPFFSTKPVGEGTGLGLSVSMGLIEKNGGRFYYDTSSPHTRFVLELKKH